MGKVVFFVHGFPDKPEVFVNQRIFFEGKGYKVHLLTIFNEERKLSYSEFNRNLLSLMSDPTNKYYLVGHDFGTWYVAHAYSNQRIRSMIKKTIFLSVPPNYNEVFFFFSFARLFFNPFIYFLIMIILYYLSYVPQVFNVVMELLKKITKYTGITGLYFSYKKMQKIKDYKYLREQLTLYMPYGLTLWFTSNFYFMRKFYDFPNIMNGNNSDILFIQGSNDMQTLLKPTTEQLLANNGIDTVTVPNSNHWFYTHYDQGYGNNGDVTFVNKVMKRFMES